MADKTRKYQGGVKGNKGNPNPPYQFPAGNQFWQRRYKHGREKIITDPQFLLDAASEYFQLCLDNPIYVVDFKGKDVEQVQYPKPKVFQKLGLALYCHCAKWETISQLKTVSNDFLEVVEKIENVIYTQKFENAVIGVFNAVLIARDLKIADVTESTITTTTIDTTKLTDEQLEAIRNAR